MTSTGRVMRADARHNRERLVAAAEQVFGELGPEASLNRVAQRAGVGPGTLYRHFPTRQALLAAVLQDRIAGLCARADALLSAASPDAALVEWLGAFLAHVRINQGLGGELLTAPAAAAGVDCHQAIRAAAAAVLTRAQRSGTARADLTVPDLIQLVAGIGMITAHHADDPAQPERLLTLVVDAVFAGPR